MRLLWFVLSIVAALAAYLGKHTEYMQAVWQETLSAVNMTAVRERKTHFEAVRDHETRSAKAFGIDSVFTTSHLSLSGAYIRFLQVCDLLTVFTVPCSQEHCHGQL